MALNIVEPSRSINQIALSDLKHRVLFKVVAGVSIVAFLFIIYISQDPEVRTGVAIPLVMAVIMALVYDVSRAFARASTSFWTEVTTANGWQYAERGDAHNEKAIILRLGDGREISHVVEGEIEGRRFRAFNYNFWTEHRDSKGRRSRTYSYFTVVAFKFDGTFPHLCLDNRRNWVNNFGSGEELPLPHEFEKTFKILAPRKYEIEALQIFSPDVLQAILDHGLKHDVEFVEQEMIVFVKWPFRDFKTFKEELERAFELESILRPKLDGFAFHKIGDMSYYL